MSSENKDPPLNLHEDIRKMMCKPICLELPYHYTMFIFLPATRIFELGIFVFCCFRTCKLV